MLAPPPARYIGQPCFPECKRSSFWSRFQNAMSLREPGSIPGFVALLFYCILLVQVPRDYCTRRWQYSLIIRLLSSVHMCARCTVPYGPQIAHTVPYGPLIAHTVPYGPLIAHTVPYGLQIAHTPHVLSMERIKLCTTFVLPTNSYCHTNLHMCLFVSLFRSPRYFWSN